MRLSRRQFTQVATGTVAFASTPALLKRAGLAAEEPIRVGNILDQTGGLNIYSLKQIKALAMAVDELNQAGGLLGRPLELFFYDSQSNNQLNSQYATQAFVRDKVQVLHGGITSLLARGDAPDRAQVRRPAVLQLALRGRSLRSPPRQHRHGAGAAARAAGRLRREREGREEGLRARRRLQLRPDHLEMDAEAARARPAARPWRSSSSRSTSPTSRRRSAGSRRPSRTSSGRRWSAARISRSIASSRRRSARPT